MPYNKIAEENEPNMKYFKPASIDKFEYLFIEHKIYKAKLCNSKDKYIINKSLEDINKNMPSILISIIMGNSIDKKISLFILSYIEINTQIHAIINNDFIKIIKLLIIN
jgi:hypothetical protein